MKYRVHLYNPFGKKIRSVGYPNPLSTWELAESIKRVWEGLYPECKVQIESLTMTGTMPLVM